VFEIGTNPPHKAPPTIQELLKRAKLLKGRDVLFSTDMPMYIQKAKAYPGMRMVVGADTLLRMFDPKWGIDIDEMLKTFHETKTEFAVAGRTIDGKFVKGWDAVVKALGDRYQGNLNLFVEVDGQWDVSSTELRNQLK